MNSFARANQDFLDYGCGACKNKVEELGPIQGPERAVDHDIHRGVGKWQQTPEEWAGQDLPDSRY